MPRLLTFLVSLCASMTAHAALYLPEFDGGAPADAVTRAQAIQTNQFRVLIFPHYGEYSVPQGRETEISTQSVKVSCNDECGIYAAAQDQDGNWYKSGPPLSYQKEFSLSATKFNELRKSHGLSATQTPVFYYDCRAPFTVQRSAPHKSFEYSGSFVAYLENKRVQIVNLVEPETYIKGVIPSEMSPTWAPEALKVQAVAARTYAWWTVYEARTQSARYDMDDTVFFQAYLGNSARTPQTDAASDATAGLVLKYQGKPIKAYFSADSGGYTESARSVFALDLPYCVAKPEQYELTQAIRPSDWTRSFTAAELQKALITGRDKMKGLLPAGTKIAELDILERNGSGRVQKLKLTASNGKKYTLLATDFRYLTQLRSTLFELKRAGAEFVFTGRGYGHGVGMSQVGALTYHQKLGWKFDQILRFYYPETVLEAE